MSKLKNPVTMKVILVNFLKGPIERVQPVELFTVNYVRTDARQEKYRKSAIPYMQRKLNFLWYKTLFCDKTHDILMRMLIIL